MATTKQLRIQTGVVQRLNNELRYYSREVDLLKAKFDSLKAANSDEAKQAGQCYLEAQKVVPQVMLQLTNAHKDLVFMLEKNFAHVEVLGEEPEITEEVKLVLNARTQLNRTTEIIPDIEQRVEKSLKDDHQDTQESAYAY